MCWLLMTSSCVWIIKSLSFHNVIPARFIASSAGSGRAAIMIMWCGVDWLDWIAIKYLQKKQVFPFRVPAWFPGCARMMGSERKQSCPRIIVFQHALFGIQKNPPEFVDFGKWGPSRMKSKTVMRIQGVLVLLWWIVQYGAVRPLLWTWTWRTQWRSGSGDILVVECKVLECGWVVEGCGLWSVEEFQNLVLEFVCMGIWFWNLIILKSFKFLSIQIHLDWFLPKLYHEMRSGGK